MFTPRILGCAATLLLAAWGCERAHTRNTEPQEHAPRESTPPMAAEAGAPKPTQAPSPTAAKPPDPPAGSATTEQPPDPPKDEPATKPAMMPAPISEWRMMGYDLGSTYFNRSETKLTKQNAGALQVAWQADMGGNFYGTALHVGSTIYAAGPMNVRAMDAESGKELWRADVKVYSASLAYADGTLFMHTHSEVVALQAADGKQLWKQALDATDGCSSTIPVGDLVVVGGSNGSRELSAEPFRGFVTALDRKTGAQVWLTRTTPEGTNGASVWSTPTIDERSGRVFAATGNNFGPPASNTSDAILSFELKSGAPVWVNQRVQNDTWGFNSSAPDADFGANPVLYEAMVAGELTQLVAAGSKAGEAHAVRRDDGKLVWTRKLCEGSSDGRRGIYLNSSWSGKYVLMACNQDGPATLFALDGGTGDIVWQRALDENVWSRISIANGVGFLGSGTKLVAFDADTGAIIATYPSRTGSVGGTISVANGRVAFGEGFTWATGRSGRTLTMLKVP